MRAMGLGVMAGVLAALPAAGQEAAPAGEDGPLAFDAVPADAAAPFGGMAISPTRVVLEAGGRGASLTLYNSGSSPVTYRIDEAELALDEEGNYRALADGETAPWAATPYLRYSPRQVTLQPGQRQSVRVIARAPRDLPPGELRSHLSVSTIPLVAPADDDADKPEAQGDNRTVAVKVGLEYRITIPVLLRTGRPQGGSAIAAAVPDDKDGTRSLEVTLARTGERSDYGAVRAFDADGMEIGLVRGVAVLPPGATRTVRLPLQGDRPAVRVTYAEEDVGGAKGALLAEYTLP
ncbi:molecular chaperone [Porphyrobacter sp. AAP60]|uniref:fimbrial biogenesis chaperone n=1 Tax=Porphyrobacter sp. AAP60 TaxID=1523423 RepID=UPI0006B949E7|nr:fimbria/pilus periplasmic chaperone [Porphyrobacter sp. AAP60]KPF62437.1 hypothetical protein IP79_12670 [Porphyrobacter sp. AAP60]